MITGEQLISEARKLVAEQNYNKAKEIFYNASQLFLRNNNIERYAWSLAAAGYMGVIVGDINKSMNYFIQAAQNGYNDIDKVEQLKNVAWNKTTIGNTHKYKLLVKLIRDNAMPIKIIQWNNDCIDNWKWMKYSYINDSLKLRKYIPNYEKCSEWDILIKSLKWVHELLKHDPINKARSYNPIDIIKESKKLKALTCKEYSILYSAILQSYGFASRVIAIMKNQYGYGTGKGHWVVEVWSNEYNKWILFDPQNNCYWKNGDNILNAFEIREVMVSNNMPIPFVNGKINIDLQNWSEYYQCIWIYNNQNYFSNWDYLSDVEEVSSLPILYFQNKERQYVTHHRSEDYLYPKMNKVGIKIKVHKNKLFISMTNSAPFFANYKITINGNVFITNKNVFIHKITGERFIKLGIQIHDLYDRLYKPTKIELSIK